MIKKIVTMEKEVKENVTVFKDDEKTVVVPNEKIMYIEDDSDIINVRLMGSRKNIAQIKK